MKFFTGWQYLLIDAATHMGFDKLTFEKRIEWAETNLKDLEAMADVADSKPLYLKAVMAIRKAQAGMPTGHLVGLDATCSGIQIMSVLTGCIAGATATGLIDPNRRADAYTDITVRMNDILGSANAITVPRDEAKRATMTSFYGSKKVPKTLFGKGTPELEAFYDAAQTIAPGAWDLLQTLLSSWQPFALSHDWKMPDGFDVRVKVMTKKDLRIQVDELDKASFTYQFYENQGAKSGLSNAANVVHSVDAYVLRCMHRRCNYNREVAEEAARVIEIELIQRSLRGQEFNCLVNKKVAYYMEQYTRSSMADIVILPYLNADTVQALDTEHLRKLAAILSGMLQYEPFELVTVHDEFKAHANNMNWVRWQYREILSELADSEVLDDILEQIHGYPGSFPKLSFNLSEQIKGGAYALC